MSQADRIDFVSIVAEELVLLYLRLNGYLALGGYLLHRSLDAGEGLRTEIDAIGVRLPFQREPLHDGEQRAQPNDPALILPQDTPLIDFVVAEVKTGKRRPRFNDPLAKDNDESRVNLEDLLSMLGCLGDDNEIREAAQAISAGLRTPTLQEPVSYDVRDGRTRIRFPLFWEPEDGQDTRRHFISLSHVLGFVEKRTRPGDACGPYSRLHAKWRGVARHILDALDEARQRGTAQTSARQLAADIERRLGREATRIL